VRWGNESWIGDFLRGASSPSRSLAGPAPLTAVRPFPDKAVSQPPLPDHAELAAAVEAQREAARTRRSGRPIRRRGRARTSEPVGGFSASALSGSLAGPAQFTAVRCSGTGWSRPLLPDHAELAAEEQAQREAARARRGGRPIRRALTSQFNEPTHRRWSAEIRELEPKPPAQQSQTHSGGSRDRPVTAWPYYYDRKQ
jgi:hypothetical protein